MPKGTTARWSPNERSVLGIDASLSGTGMVVLDIGGVREHSLVSTKPADGTHEARIDIILGEMLRLLDEHLPTVVAIEGYAFSKHSSALSPLHELGGVLKHYLHYNEHLFLTPPPTSVKHHATGRGNAKKDEMVDAAWEAGFEVVDDNLADAFFVAKFVLDKFDELIGKG